MRLKKIENNSNEDVELKHKNGAKTTLPPGTELKDIDIVNISEVKGKTKTIVDLTEVKDDQGKQKLYDWKLRSIKS